MKYISVVIPCFNQGKYLEKAIRSIGDLPVEIIVVNNGSDDNTDDVAKKLNVTLLHEAKRGIGAAFNTGIGAAIGKYILPLSADDEVSPVYIPMASMILDENPNIDIVVPDYLVVSKAEAPYIWKQEGLIDDITQRNTMFFSSFYRKSMWEELGGYEENMPYAGWEDWDFWIKAYKAHKKVKFLNAVGIKYMVHEESCTQRDVIPHVGELTQWMRDNQRI